MMKGDKIVTGGYPSPPNRESLDPTISYQLCDAGTISWGCRNIQYKSGKLTI